jgi:hypothetical protein
VPKIRTEKHEKMAEKKVDEGNWRDSATAGADLSSNKTTNGKLVSDGVERSE